MQREEVNERRKLSELQAKLDGMKIKDVALKVNKSTKQATTSKSKSKLKQHHHQVKMKVMVHNMKK
jgi:transcriptional antiterminator